MNLAEKLLEKNPIFFGVFILIALFFAYCVANFAFHVMLYKSLGFSFIDIPKHLIYLGDLPNIAKKAKISGILGTISLVPFGYLLFSIPSRALFGSAKFASSQEVHKAGLFSENGVIVGKKNNKYLRLDGQQHIFLSAPTRSGKGVGIVVPNCLSWSESLIVLDIKQENYNISSGFRAKCGQKVFLFNPGAEDGKTARWNPFDYVNKNNHITRTKDIQQISTFFIKEGKEGISIWISGARGLFCALAMLICETPELPFTIGEVNRQLKTGQDTKEYFDAIIAKRIAEGNPLSDETVMAMNAFSASGPIETRSSIQANLISSLNLFDDAVLDSATSASDFDFRDLRKTPTSIFIGISPDQIGRLSNLISLFFQQLFETNLKTLPDKQKDPYKVLLLLDEFTSLGKMPIFSSAISYAAGYNLRIMPIIQSFSQLEDVYGKDAAKNFRTNHALQIVYTPREQSDAKEISETLGDTTVKGRSTSKSDGLFSEKNNQSTSESDQRRALLLPQEVREIPFDKELVLYENTKPIFADKILYYKDENFTQRLLPRLEPKVITLHRPKLILLANTKPIEIIEKELDTPEKIASVDLEKADIGFTINGVDITDNSNLDLSFMQAVFNLSEEEVASSSLLESKQPIKNYDF